MVRKPITDAKSQELRTATSSTWLRPWGRSGPPRKRAAIAGPRLLWASWRPGFAQHPTPAERSSLKPRTRARLWRAEALS
ncbi:F-Box Only Protein 40 [Manis pentadactyla]|nr:F-Box Only Protein 40 [Manis pentadactyla]